MIKIDNSPNIFLFDGCRLQLAFCLLSSPVWAASSDVDTISVANGFSVAVLVSSDISERL